MINFNGKLVDKNDSVLPFFNRNFAYGDGIFETIRMMGGRMPLLELHTKRLIRGIGVLGMALPKEFSPKYFKKEILKLTGQTQNARIKITLFREGGGLYTPEKNNPVYIIQFEKLDSSKFSWLSRGIKVDFCKTIRLHHSSLSGIKSCNALPYILASRWKDNNKLDDCLILNSDNRVAEACSSNVFYFFKNKLFTTDLKQGEVAGVMRAFLLKLANKQGIKTIEKSISKKDILKADEVFLSNAIWGMRAISQLGNKKYITFQGKKLFDMLNAEM